VLDTWSRSYRRRASAETGGTVDALQKGGEGRDATVCGGCQVVSGGVRGCQVSQVCEESRMSYFATTLNSCYHG
jgi:hypothetical protein